MAGHARPDAGRRAAYAFDPGQEHPQVRRRARGRGLDLLRAVEYAVAGCRIAKDADLEMATAKYPYIRFITVPNRGTQEPQKDFQGRGSRAGRITSLALSAVGYFFGRHLHQVLDVPIGSSTTPGGAPRARRGFAATSWPPIRSMPACSSDGSKLEKDLPCGDG